VKIEQLVIKNKEITEVKTTENFKADLANLVLVFGERKLLETELPFDSIRSKYLNAEIVICSSAGHFSNLCVEINSIVATAIQFKKSTVKCFEVEVSDNCISEGCASKIGDALFSEDLKAILLLTEGTYINGSELLDKFKEKTFVGLNKNPEIRKIVIVGLFGEALKFGFGFQGGWSDFGPERKVTKSIKSVLYEIDHRPALDLYKEYLGQYASELPGSALFFPLSMKSNLEDEAVVRTILSVDEENKSMRFAGNIIEGSIVRLMKFNSDDLIEASYQASESLKTEQPNSELTLIISCVGRKAVLGERIEEEFEAVREVLGDKTVITGFFSYGEISPQVGGIACELHNQTITLASISEN